MRRDSAGVVAGEELDVEERTTRLPDPEDLEDPGWDDERELTEALDFENLAPWHTPEAEQAPDWALELTTSYDKPATQDPELEWDDDASLTRRFDPEPEPTSPARKQSVTESGTHPALRAPAATSGKAFAAESGAHPAPRARRVGAETLPARGRDAAGRARARNPLEPARWPLSAALTAEAAEYESPRLLQVAPPHAKGTRRASGVIATPAHEQRRALRPTRQTEKVWPAPPSALPEPASQATWRPPASSAAEVAAASTRPTWRPAALADGEPAGSPRPTLRPPALPASEVAPASARTTSRRPALRQSDASAALAAAAARTQPRRPTLRERV
ncbi:MAG TPA: hypothetical protein VJR89_21550, partial [Polyangiales bacterium]|nr:hypothetical protein [Polyangiales bacterium]